MKPIDKLAWVYLKDRKILTTRSKGKNAWYIPGGKREEGESDQQALIREIKEELEVDLIPETLTYLDKFKAQAHGKPDGVLVQLTCYTGDYKGELKPSAEIEAISWFNSNANLKLLSDSTILLLNYLKEKDLID